MHSTSRLLRVLAAALAVAVLGAAVVAWTVVGAIGAAGESLRASGAAIDTIDSTIDTTEEIVSTVHEGLGSLDALAGNVADSSGITATVIRDVSDLTTNDLPDSLRTVEDAMPALIEVGAVVDDTLRTLSVIGVAYAPAVPFDEALREVQASLHGLPEELAHQGRTLGTLAPVVDDIGAQSERLAGEIRTTRSRLEDASLLLDDYRTVLADARSTLAGAPSPVMTTALEAVVIVATVAGLVLSVVLWRLAAVREEVVTHAPGATADGPTPDIS